MFSVSWIHSSNNKAVTGDVLQSQTVMGDNINMGIGEKSISFPFLSYMIMSLTSILIDSTNVDAISG